MSDRAGLFLLVGVVTAFRLCVLALTPTDLFYDEAQYWAWGRDFAWGYFSKPPLIAWVIGTTTSLAGSDSTFWVRMAAPLFHGFTAFILAEWMGRIHRPAALWVAAVYLAMPVLVIGSWMISTDTIMAPFLTAALWSWWQAVETRKWQSGALAGALAGIAVLAKYAGAYFWVSVAIAAFWPGLRPAPRALGAALLAFMLTIAPNLLWNVQNGLVTLSHTADNARIGGGIATEWRGLLEFLASQAFVIGPIFAVFWLGAIGRSRSRIETYLLASSIPILALVAFQAFTAKANANWAFAAYPAAAALVGLRMSRAGQTKSLLAGLGVNLVLILAVTVLIVRPGLAPKLTDRYTGRSAVTARILALSQGRPIVSEEREILADLTYAARVDGAPRVFARTHAGVPRHWYDMAASRLENAEVALVTYAASQECNGVSLAPEASVAPDRGAYSGRHLYIYNLPSNCP